MYSISCVVLNLASVVLCIEEMLCASSVVEPLYYGPLNYGQLIGVPDACQLNCVQFKLRSPPYSVLWT